MWNRRKVLGVGAALMGSGLPGLHAQTPTPAPKVVIAVERKAAFCYLPLSIAERKGYFAAEGLDVVVREWSKPGAALQAVQSGVAQVLSGPYGLTFSQQLKGQPHTAFVLQARTPQLVLGVSHKAVARYRGLRDLRGRRIGVMGMETASHQVTRMLLSRAGLTVASDVKFIGLSTPTEAAAAFYAGEIDAICYDDPVITQLEQSGAMRVLADTRTVRGCAEVFGGPMPAGCLSATTKFVSEQGAVCQALVHAMVHGLKWLQTAGPSDIIKTVPEHFFLGDRALYLAAFSRAREAWTPDGMMPAQGPEIAARLWASQQAQESPERLDLARTFTNDFARKAKAKFKA